MLKRKALQRNQIALLLAVILMFCAFGADGVATGESLNGSTFTGAESVLVSPEAGEFFTGSLPIQKQQSVSQTSAHWQGNIILRPGRITGGRGALKEIRVSIGLPESLCKTIFYREYSMAEGREAEGCCREVIVCYIHNQDGAKG